MKVSEWNIVPKMKGHECEKVSIMQHLGIGQSSQPM
jgi:hypothetical protein